VSLAFFLSPLPEARNSDIYLLSRNQELLFEYSDPAGGIQKAPGRIPETLKAILLLAEDQDFYSHGGVDFQAMARAFYTNLRAGRIVSGASTIPQQYVRNNFKSRMPGNPYLRKPVEALYAIKLGAKSSKDAILSDYIATVPLGKNRKGFFAASKHYFGKDLALLSCEEAMTLVVLLRRTSMNPKSLLFRMNLLRNRIIQEDPELARKCEWKAGTALEFPSSYRYSDPSASRQGGADNPGQASEQEAGKTDGGDSIESKPRIPSDVRQSEGSRNDANAQPSYESTEVDADARQSYENSNDGNVAKSDENSANIVKAGLTPSDQASAYEASGYPHSAPHLGVYLYHDLNIRGTVHTELDSGLQSHIQSIIRSELEVLEGKGANQAAVIVLEMARSEQAPDGSGPAASQGGNRPPAVAEDSPGAGSPAPAKDDGGSPLQDSQGLYFWKLRAMIGSSDFAGEDGQVNGALAINDAGSVLKPFLYALAVEQLGFRPGTLIDDSEFVVSDSIRKETYAPRNHDLRYSGIITLREALAGSRNVPAVRLIERLGIQQFYELLKTAGFEHMQEPARDYGPSLALGTGGATLFEVTLLYGALAARGEMLPVQIASQPRIRFGQNKRLFQENTALLIRHILSDKEARRGSFGPRSFLDFPFDVAAKTGTSKDFRDSWAVGYTDRYVVGVWVGNFQSDPTLGVSGSRGAGRIMHQVMRMLHESGGPRFEYPENWKYANICKKTGHLAGPNCAHFTEPFLPYDAFPPPCSGNHQGSQPTGILHPLDDQIFVLDPHRPADSQSVLLEIRAPADVACRYWLNGKEHRLPADGHLRKHIDPRPGKYEVVMDCAGGAQQRTLFRIQD
tara:strand:- start:100153 stop:102705 length:2553 start_codon:yes stop_codon:yes gene_type:complete